MRACVRACVRRSEANESDGTATHARLCGSRNRNQAVSGAFPDFPANVASLLSTCRGAGLETVFLREGSNARQSPWYDFWQRLNPGKVKLARAMHRVPRRATRRVPTGRGFWALPRVSRTGGGGWGCTRALSPNGRWAWSSSPENKKEKPPSTVVCWGLSPCTASLRRRTRLERKDSRQGRAAKG